MKLLEFLRLKGDDATGTRLELAQAFAELGDADLARSLLNEVMAEGSDDQKRSAESLMDSICPVPDSC